MEPKTISLGQLRAQLEVFDDDWQVFFGAGNLTFFRTKARGDKLLQIEFSEDTTGVRTLDERD